MKSSRAVVLLLALLLLRAYVPAGFMPANGAPFALQLCPGALSMPAHQHHHAGGRDTGAHDSGHGSGTHSDLESCPFGSAPAAGPISHHLTFAAALPAPVARIETLDSLPPTLRALRTHHPRGPPA